MPRPPVDRCSRSGATEVGDAANRGWHLVGEALQLPHQRPRVAPGDAAYAPVFAVAAKQATGKRARHRTSAALPATELWRPLLEERSATLAVVRRAGECGDRLRLVLHLRLQRLGE